VDGILASRYEDLQAAGAVTADVPTVALWHVSYTVLLEATGFRQQSLQQLKASTPELPRALLQHIVTSLW